MRLHRTRSNQNVTLLTTCERFRSQSSRAVAWLHLDKIVDVWLACVDTVKWVATCDGYQPSLRVWCKLTLISFNRITKIAFTSICSPVKCVITAQSFWWIYPQTARVLNQIKPQSSDLITKAPPDYYTCVDPKKRSVVIVATLTCTSCKYFDLKAFFQFLGGIVRKVMNEE